MVFAKKTSTGKVKANSFTHKERITKCGRKIVSKRKLSRDSHGKTL